MKNICSRLIVDDCADVTKVKTSQLFSSSIVTLSASYSAADITSRGGSRRGAWGAQPPLKLAKILQKLAHFLPILASTPP